MSSNSVGEQKMRPNPPSLAAACVAWNSATTLPSSSDSRSIRRTCSCRPKPRTNQSANGKSNHFPFPGKNTLHRKRRLTRMQSWSSGERESAPRTETRSVSEGRVGWLEMRASKDAKRSEARRSGRRRPPNIITARQKQQKCSARQVVIRAITCHHFSKTRNFFRGNK